MMDKIATLVEKIKAADAVIVGAGSGMSAATGLNFWYQNTPEVMEHFEYFYDKYHFQGLFDASYTQFDSEEERWAFTTILANLIYTIEPPKPTYQYLKTLLKQKNYHIITTNQDDLFLRYFTKDKISMIQGSWSYLQSSNPDTDKNLYDARKIFAKLTKKISNHKIAREDFPRSEVDGSVLTPWYRSPKFLEDKQYYIEHEKFNNFIGQYKNQKILFLELGVGRMTPMFIQEPFWEMTKYLPKAYYININPKDARTNPAIEDKSLLINDDINEALKQAVEIR
ncbi:NAD-dependent SIR2 family protein deacetylase [Lactobacillus colini]|uniref:NAD-dependent SIR2 family protein deacetylase n=1 Tax=Lactobacillus colini TaxID=1819254 RepID=A0ABS4MHE6_9LACO|nr:Sir2 silent information regulator family NAD-dependent deacetylase [Lactobacillus colini]MBP2058774.1 NAD-dependent SIR2 family protein deacetylase [Lactobacillus colini]